jgi:hypothetical protein
MQSDRSETTDWRRWRGIMAAWALFVVALWVTWDHPWEMLAVGAAWILAPEKGDFTCRPIERAGGRDRD